MPLIPVQRMAFSHFRLLPIIGLGAQISAGTFSLCDGIGITEHPGNSTISRAPLANRQLKALNPSVDVVDEVAVIVGDVNMHTTHQIVDILGKPGDVSR